VDQQENLSVDIWRFFEDLEEIRRGGGPATDRFPSSRPKGESDFDPHRAISPTREPRGGAVSLSVRDERGGSYLPGTAPETTPLFDRTNLHPLYPRLLDLLNRNSRTSFIPAKKFFLFERGSAFRKELSGEMLGFARTIQFGVIRNFLKRNSTYTLKSSGPKIELWGTLDT
jgi:hypothetical protein